MRRNKSVRTISQKLFVPQMALIFVLIIIFTLSIVLSGITDQARDVAFENFSERVSLRHFDLQNQMVSRWSNISDFEEAISDEIQLLLERQGRTTATLKVNDSLTNSILASIAPELISIIRQNSVTGAFVAFSSVSSSAPNKRAILSIVDDDPNSNPSDHSDLLIERGSLSISENLSIPTNVSWEPTLDVSRENSERIEFYSKVIAAAAANQGAKSTQLGYWSPAFTMSENSGEIITYSQPLISKAGTVYGVIGVQISVKQIKDLISYKDMHRSQQATMIVGMKDANVTNEYKAIIRDGYSLRKFLSNEGKIEFSENKIKEKIYPFTALNGSEQMKFICVREPLNLYNQNSPFANEKWTVVAALPKRILLADYYRLVLMIVFAGFFSLVVGLVGFLVMTKMLADPIKRISKKIKGNTDYSLAIGKTDIKEIDELADEIQKLGIRVSQANLQLSQMLNMTDSMVAAFEYNIETGECFCTDKLHFLLDYVDDEEKGPLKSLIDRLNFLESSLTGEDTQEDTHVYNFFNRNRKLLTWVKIRYSVENSSTIGVVVDITKESLDKRKAEYERDHDILTGLINRNAFLNGLRTLFNKPKEIGCGAMLMIDLDNLKYVNDKIGHDSGDEYIKTMARIIKNNLTPKALSCRISGDEFYVFFYGADSKKEIIEKANSMWAEMRTTQLGGQIGEIYQVRASGGLAWYPDDAETFEMLMKYADFAMYTSKNNKKGNFVFFDSELYARDFYLIEGREEISRLVEEKLYKYEFQPIINSETGEVFGYESLMRPQTPLFKSPADLLRIARIQSKLYDIERISLLDAPKRFREIGGFETNCMLFINSVSNQILINEDMEDTEMLLDMCKGRIVIEITEEENFNAEYTAKKADLLHKYKSKLALDDFGTGYNGESALLSLNPDFVKVDMSIVRNIDTDENRQVILQNLLFYARRQNIKIIAEGVETKGEMEYLIRNGIEYLQGYYLGRPNEKLIDIPQKIKDEIIAAAQK